MCRAIQLYFTDMAKSQGLAFKKTLAHGLKSLMIGLTFLFICVFSYYSSKDLPDTLINNYLKEGLHVLGWVSMWHPINIFLYEWWPIVAKRNLLQRIADSSIQIFSEAKKERDLDHVI